MHTRRMLLALACAPVIAVVTWLAGPNIESAAERPAQAVSATSVLATTTTSTAGPTTTTTAKPRPTTTTTATTTTTVPRLPRLPRAFRMPALPAPPPPPPPPAPPAPAPVPAVPNGQLGTIRIPRIGLAAQLGEGVSQPVLNQGPGHWPGTARPGMNGNMVIGGHRTTYSQPFLNIDWLQPGNQLIFNGGGVEAVYSVTGTQIVPETAVWITNPTPNATVTLFSCHPKGSSAQRIVVRGTLVSVRKG